MTARYNAFKDPTTECEAPTAYGQFVGTRQSQEQSRLGRLPGVSIWANSNSVKNVPNVQRGHSAGNGEKSDGYRSFQKLHEIDS